MSIVECWYCEEHTDSDEACDVSGEMVCRGCIESAYCNHCDKQFYEEMKLERHE